MRWRNTETPTFSGSDGRSDNTPDFVESLDILDRDGNEVASFNKDVAGVITFELDGVEVASSATPVNATSTELNQLNDVSAYQESVIAAGALSVTKVYSGLAVVGGGAVTLAAPSATMLGQLKTIEMTTDDGNVTLALTNVVGGTAATTATFDAVRDTLVLLAAYDKWVVIKESGVALT